MIKYSAFVAIFACVLSAALAFDNAKVDQVHSEVMSYVQENMGDVRMMRGSAAHLECYNDFIPTINRLALEAKENSTVCVVHSDQQMEQAMTALKEARAELAAEVQKIQDSLNECTARPEGLGYFECLLQLVDGDKQILDTIASKSSALLSQYGDKIRNIDSDEQACLRRAVDDAKVKSDNAFEALRVCLAAE